MKRKWTKEEDELLIKLISEDKNYKYISKILNRTTTSCARHGWGYLKLKCSNVYRKKYSVDEDFWETPNKINAYYAGFSAADCTIRKVTENQCQYKLMLSSLDEAFLDRFREYVKYTGPIYKTKRTNKGGSISNVVSLEISSTKWVNDLGKNFNIIPRKTRILQPPPLDKKLIWCWLCGMFCGDGCIHFRYIKSNHNNPFPNLCIMLTTSSKVLIDFVSELIISEFKDNCLKLHVSPIHGFCRVKKLKNCEAYAIYVNGLRAAVLFDYLSQIQGLPRLERKWLQPKVLEHVANLKQKHPHLFKTFEFNDELNKINYPIIENSLDIPPSQPIISV